jgi:hypothetical protein
MERLTEKQRKPPLFCPCFPLFDGECERAAKESMPVETGIAADIGFASAGGRAAQIGALVK